MTADVDDMPAPAFPTETILPLRIGSRGIYDSHAPLLRAIARRKFDVPEADVDSLVHDVFATFLACPARVRDLRAYLIGGICNTSRDYWRRQKQDTRLFTEADETTLLSEDVKIP
jgi:DNA-directed RNA polymerase specialized sigma24 family protein